MLRLERETRVAQTGPLWRELATLAAPGGSALLGNYLSPSGGRQSYQGERNVFSYHLENRARILALRRRRGLDAARLAAAAGLRLTHMPRPAYVLPTFAGDWRAKVNDNERSDGR